MFYEGSVYIVSFYVDHLPQIQTNPEHFHKMCPISIHFHTISIFIWIFTPLKGSTLEAISHSSSLRYLLFQVCGNAINSTNKLRNNFGWLLKTHFPSLFFFFGGGEPSQMSCVARAQWFGALGTVINSARKITEHESRITGNQTENLTKQHTISHRVSQNITQGITKYHTATDRVRFCSTLSLNDAMNKCCAMSLRIQKLRFVLIPSLLRCYWRWHI